MAQRHTDYEEPPVGPFSAGGAFDHPASARQQATARLRVWLTYPAWAVLIVTLVAAHFFPAAALRWQYAPFLLGMVLLGLPHGALDHLAPLLLRHWRLTPAYLALFMAGYLACVATYLLFWRVWPLAALSVFLLISWLHWGQGDDYFLEVFLRRPTRSRAERLVRWLVRGGLPIVLPILAFPQVFAQVSGGILGWYGRSGGWQLNDHWRLAGFIALEAILALYLWQSWQAERQEFWRDAGEVGLLFLYFATVPPILAVGLYFCFWHSARHLARLLLLDDVSLSLLSRGAWAEPLLRTARRAAPMTLGALALLAGLFWRQGRMPVSAADLLWLYLSLIAALTFPHFLLVLWMDREERCA